MSIPLVAEPTDIPIRSIDLERCCFCRTRTNMWHAEKDVACCESCAQDHEEGDLPTKEEWCRKEAGLTRKASIVTMVEDY